MASNISLQDLIYKFHGKLDEDVIFGVYHDMHGHVKDTEQVLLQLQSGALSSQISKQDSGRIKPLRNPNNASDRRVYHQPVKIPGYNDRKALYIMRGLSGSGKSTYAKKIIDDIGSGKIFSTDEFFMLNEANEYRFVQADLDVAHSWNRKRVEDALHRGISPVIVDNTNTQFWEMRPYVIAGVENGYNCYFIEPPTNWKFKVNILYKKSKHGLSKAQLVAALKRYEKNPTVEKVIGKGYQPKQRELKPGEFMRNEKNSHSMSDHASSPIPKSSPLVPYTVSSESSDETNGDKAPAMKMTSQTQHPECSNYRDYNNNSRSPKVLTEKRRGHRGFKRGSGLNNLGNINNHGESSRPIVDGENGGDGSDVLISEKEVAEWDQDMATWMAEKADRDLEDDLLRNLELQNNGEVDSEMTDVIDLQQLRQASVKQLSSWCCDDRVTSYDPATQSRGLQLQRNQAVDRDIFVRNQDIDSNTKAIDDESSKSKSCSLPESETSSQIARVSPVLRYVSKMESLKNICKSKLRSQLLMSYHNSAAYWAAVKTANSLPPVRSWTALPEPPEPVLTETGSNKLPSPVNKQVHKVGKKVWQCYADVGREKVGLPVGGMESLVKHAEKSEHEEETNFGNLDEKDEDLTEEARPNEAEESENEIRVVDDDEEGGEMYPETVLTPDQLLAVEEVECIFGNNRRKSIISALEECDWDKDEVLESLLLKDSLKELADESARNADKETVSKLPIFEPPSLKSLLSGEEASPVTSDNEEITGQTSGQDVPMSSSAAHSNAGTEVAKLTLPPKLVATLTQLYGTIVGIDTNKSVTIPVNTELAASLHAALYFANAAAAGKTKRRTRGKEKAKKVGVAVGQPPPLVPNQSAVPFRDIVSYQSGLPKQRGKLKKLAQAYPGIDESFLDDVLTSCGNDLQRALNALKTDSVHLKHMQDEELLYSTRIETPPQRKRYDSNPSIQSYNSVSGACRGTSIDDFFISPANVTEKAEACRAHSRHNIEQAKLWHSKKQHLVAAHYAKQGAKYRELAKTAEMEQFDRTVVKARLRDLKKNTIVDLHGYTLAQSKFLVTQLINRSRRMIGIDVDFPRTVTLITGKGLHSAGGVPRLKHGVRTLLEEHRIQYQEEADGYKLRFK